MLRYRGLFMLRKQALRPYTSSFSLVNLIGRRNLANSSNLIQDDQLESKNNNGNSTPSINQGTEIKENSQPWYLTMVERDRTQSLSHINDTKIEIPEQAPKSLIRITNYLKDEMGLENILIFDINNKEDNNYTTAVAKVCDFVIIATARSAKHCQKCFVQLNAMLKQDFNSIAHVEGKVNAKEERKRIKRMARKSNLGKSWGANSESTTGFTKDLEAWFMIDCHVDNIFVNILTEKRRTELNLEELYAPESERSKYQLHQNVNEEIDELRNNLTEVEDENNILLGLRRLAYQRRQYSTLTPKLIDRFKIALDEKNFQDAKNLVNQTDDSQSLNLLQTMTDSLANLNVTTDALNSIDHWYSLFEICWPLVLPQETAFQFWSLRLKFLKMLNIANPQLYPCSRIIDDYLVRKQVTGFHLNRDDLLQFIQMIKINLSLKKNCNYWDLVRSNETLVSALKLCNDSNIIDDELITSMLIKTLVLDNNTSIKLHSLYEIIDFLSTQPKNLSSNVIVTILETLASINDWNKFFKFWETGIKDILPGQDYRPWNKFINIIVNSNNVELMQKLIDEGHLLWLKRNEVEMTPELVEQLKLLLRKINYNSQFYLDI